jgi:hypothetical protein
MRKIYLPSLLILFAWSISASPQQVSDLESKAKAVIENRDWFSPVCKQHSREETEEFLLSCPVIPNKA